MNAVGPYKSMGGPSWSWDAVDDHVTFSDERSVERRSLFEKEKVKIQLAGENELDGVESASLRLRAYLLQGIISSIAYTFEVDDAPRASLPAAVVRDRSGQDMGWCIFDAIVFVPRDVACLPIISHK